jgi:hypothetical protein
MELGLDGIGGMVLTECATDLLCDCFEVNLNDCGSGSIRSEKLKIKIAWLHTRAVQQKKTVKLQLPTFC